MTYLEEIKKTIGEEIFTALEKEADAEVGRNVQYPLQNEWRQDIWYSPTISSVDNVIKYIDYFYKFEELGLKISPLDIINILYRCKLIFAFQTEQEYQRKNSSMSWVDEITFSISWELKTKGLDNLIERYFERMKTFEKTRYLLATTTSFDDLDSNVQDTFKKVFNDLDLPYYCFFQIPEMREAETELANIYNYDDKDLQRYFGDRSFGYKEFGSSFYIYWRGTINLRNFLNLLRIKGFIYPPQVDFGQENIKILPPISPVFALEGSLGGYCWNEDTKPPHYRMPDGCLTLSFGYKGYSKMWMDGRTHGTIDLFFKENKLLLDLTHKNPWSHKVVNDVSPILEILSNLTQTADDGAKVLLAYTCLEHLFVPKEGVSENKKYIIGGITALDETLITWFNDLYKLRCQYAHKGFILSSNETRGLIRLSVVNILKLLKRKLSV